MNERISELRQLIRSYGPEPSFAEKCARNNPVGKLGEILVASMLDARLARQGTMGYDMKADGNKIQSKVLLQSSRNWKGQTACLKNYEFDFLVIALLDRAELNITSSWCLTPEEAREKSSRRHDKWKETGGKIKLGNLG